MDKVALLEEVAARWNDARVRYAVAHGLEGYPVTTGRDLDVLVHPDDVANAIECGRLVVEERALFVARPPSLWGERLIVAANSGAPDMVEIHTIRRIAWRNALFADRPRPTERLGPFAIDPWVSFVKRIVLPLLGGTSHKFSSDPRQFTITESELRAARQFLPGLAGRELTRSLLQYVAAGDVPGARSLATKLRYTLMRRSALRRPVRTVGLALHSISRKVLQLFSPCGPVVAVVGPPEVDKSALLRSIVEGDRLIFTQCVARPWAASPRPHQAAPGMAAHWGRLARLYARALVRSLIADRLCSSRQELVLYEGCALDLLVTPVRYGLASPRGARLCWRLLPKPDLVVLLLDDPVRVQSAAPGLTLDEAYGQYDAWRAALATEAISAVIPLGVSVEDTRRRLWNSIIGAFLRKNGGTWSGGMA